MKLMNGFCAIVLCLFFKVGNAQQKTISKLNFLDKFVIPHNLQFKKTTVGGLSGIDYNPNKEEYYMICDDRSDRNPARFYTAKIILNGGTKIDTVVFKNVFFLEQADGNNYPNNIADKFKTPDPESLRYNAKNNTMIWTSEGERIVDEKDTVLLSPSINVITPKGRLIDSFPLPQNLYMHATTNGPRRNGVLEGSTFNQDFSKLYVSLEEPLYEDGERADTKPNDAFVRFYEFNVKDRSNVAEYAYHLDPIVFEAKPADAFKVNGIPDILWLNEKQLLVIERAFSTGRQQCTIKVFLADFSNATNIIGVPSLKENKTFKPIEKKLLLNMDELGFFIDNIEGVTFGPTLPNGHASLIFIADNNFSLLEQSQVFLFEVIP